MSFRCFPTPRGSPCPTTSSSRCRMRCGTAADALRDAAVQVIADNGYRGSGFRVPATTTGRRPGTDERRRLSANQKASTPPTPGSAAGGTRQCAAQGVADLPQDPLLSDARDRPRQGHPRAHPRWLTPSGKSQSPIRPTRGTGAHPSEFGRTVAPTPQNQLPQHRPAPVSIIRGPGTKDPG